MKPIPTPSRKSINQLRRLLATGVLVSASVNAFAATLFWDINPSLANAQDGAGTWTSATTFNLSGTSPTNQAIASGDTLVFGVGSGAGFEVTVSNGGSNLDVSSNIILFRRSYTLKGDGITLGNFNIDNGSNVTIESAIASAGGRNWNVGTGTLNLSGGGTLQNLVATGAASVNITAGTWATAGASWNSGAGQLIVQHTGGTITSSTGINVGGAATAAGSSATYNLDGGSINASGLAISMGATTASAFAGNATINVISGSMTTGEYRIGNDGGSGTLNVKGGTVSGSRAVIGRVANTTVATASTLSISGGTTTLNQIQFDNSQTWVAGSTGTLNVSGGSLYLSSAGITRTGTSANFTYAINLSGGTLGAVQNWSTALDVTLTGTDGGITFKAADASGTARNITLTGALTGSGDFTKTGGGTLFLNGAKSFTGDVYLDAGTLSSNSAFLADTASLYLVTGSTLNLNFNGSDSVARLFIDGVQQDTGIYDNANLADFITGAGSLNVLTSAIPEPSSFAVLAGAGALGASMLARRRAKR